jgi:hypothetical protein
MTVQSASTPTNDLRQLPTHVAGAVVATAVVLAGVLMLVRDESWWRGYMAAMVITAVAAIASLPPLVWGVRDGGLTRAVACYFVSAGVRLIVCLGGCAMAVRKADYPRLPTLLMLMAFYFVLLAVESASLAKALWTAKA